VLDNLPIDVMDDGEGWIVAVDVMGRPRRAASSERPTFLETLARATTLGSARWVDSNRHRASVVVTPDVADIGLMDFARFDQAVTAGRTAARRALDDIRSLVGQTAGGDPASPPSSS
jgi:predicted acylesterase/phospholipase RssA